MAAVTPKEPVPLRWWALWWAILALALVVFYVLLVPVWMGLRAAAWIAELKARRSRAPETETAARGGRLD